MTTEEDAARLKAVNDHALAHISTREMKALIDEVERPAREAEAAALLDRVFGDDCPEDQNRFGYVSAPDGSSVHGITESGRPCFTEGCSTAPDTPGSRPVARGPRRIVALGFDGSESEEAVVLESVDLSPVDPELWDNAAIQAVIGALAEASGTPPELLAPSQEGMTTYEILARRRVAERMAGFYWHESLREQSSRFTWEPGA
jgi:hypothetical protein